MKSQILFIWSIEFICFLLQNYIMKKLLFSILFVFLLSSSVWAKEADKLDVKSQSFLDLGRYIETLEINDEVTLEEPEKKIEDNFEEESIRDVAKRYEKNAVELNLDEVSDSALDDINSHRVFKLKVNETQYKIEQKIRAENMIWDGSKMFTQAFVSSSKNMAPIPGIINSSNVSSQVTQDLSATVGQTYLYDSLGPSVLFVRANESMYNTGSVVAYKGEGINLSFGSFSSSSDYMSSGGAILATDSINLPKNAGSFVLGGAYFANEAISAYKTTGGAFAEYTYGRLKLNAQVGKSKYSDSVDYDTSLYFVPELKLTDSIYLKTRFIRNVSQHTMQDELALSYKPKNSSRNFEFEVNATNYYNENSNISQKIRLTTSFRI